MISKTPNQINWQAHVEKYKASGLTRQVYCRESGITLHQLAYHINRRNKVAKAGFVRVSTVSAPLPKPANFSARLVFKEGVVLEMDSTIDPKWLVSVIANVGGRP